MLWLSHYLLGLTWACTVRRSLILSTTSIGLKFYQLSNHVNQSIFATKHSIEVCRSKPLHLSSWQRKRMMIEKGVAAMIKCEFDVKSETYKRYLRMWRVIINSKFHSMCIYIYVGNYKFWLKLFLYFDSLLAWKISGDSFGMMMLWRHWISSKWHMSIMRTSVSVYYIDWNHVSLEDWEQYLNFMSFIYIFCLCFIFKLWIWWV